MKQFKFEDVKEIIEGHGWHIVSTEYVNLKKDLEVVCPEGHQVLLPFEKFKKGSQTCPICKSNKFYNQNYANTKKKGNRILAVDQASITSGWALFENKELLLFGAHTVEGTHTTERIEKTKCWLASLIQKYSPNLVILEDIQLERNVDVFKKLAQLQGVLKNYLFEINIPYKIVHPSTWRAGTSVKGRTRTDMKKSAQLLVKKQYDISVSQDEADAILIGTWGVIDSQQNEMIEF